MPNEKKEQTCQGLLNLDQESAHNQVATVALINILVNKGVITKEELLSFLTGAAKEVKEAREKVYKNIEDIFTNSTVQ